MNLLLITQVYPDEKGVKTARNSNVCHYWTKEWVKMGHQVHVIYLYSQYLPILHKIAAICPNFISQFTNGTLTRRLKNSLSYELDGVHVYKIPMYKPIPKIRYKEKVIQGIAVEITSYLQRMGITIDLIIGHFDNPVLEIGGICKALLHVPFVFVLHGYPSDIKRLYPHSYEKLIKEVDLWGFRSISIKKDFEFHYGELKKYFIAYSGIPDAYLPQEEDSLQKEKGKICYVGALIRRKYPEIVIKALVPFIQNGENSILVSSHITSDLEHIADYITFISDGRILLSKTRDELLDEYGIVHCTEEEFKKIDKKDYLRYKKNKYAYDVLIEDKKEFKKRYELKVIDKPTLDDIMVIYIKGVK